MKTENFTFPGHAGNTLSGRLDLPDGPVRATALFAHCFTCTKNILPVRRIAAALTGAGIAVLRFDFTGLGESEGSFSETSFASDVGDLLAAAKALSDKGMAPDLMIGHSLGGTAVLKAAAELDGVKAVATLGAPFAPGSDDRSFAMELAETAREGYAEARLGGDSFHVSKNFLTSVETDSFTRAIHGLNAALLIMHAPRDEVVGIDNAAEIFRAALHPKSFVTLGDADHLISAPEDAEYAASLIAAWASRYLGLDNAPAALVTPVDPAPEGVVRVTELDPAGFTQSVANGPDHFFISDEPEDVGGTNRGPNPYALLKAALGSCTSMTMRMYARVKKWPVTGISVDVSHEKVLAGEGQKDDRGRPLKLDVFTRDITLEGDLDETQRQRLLEIADRCPVHMTLHRASRIETRFAAT
jgi:uncharacterized OsmC-like protein/alpha-beta hydrolase superfamily lysophospholipase